MVRVVARWGPALYQLVGLYAEEACLPVMTMSVNGEDVHLARVKSCPRWILYDRPVLFHLEQR